MTLHELAVKYGTDKLEHGYIPFYEKFLPKEPKRILEIGVKEGKSLGVWAEYFPNAEIHGLDLFAGSEIKTVYHNIDRIAEGKLKFDQFTMHQGDQCDWKMLEQLRKYDFDVIIDDGSHNSRDQLMTFFGLFNGKHYFIEDLHCCDEAFYRQLLPMGVTAKKLFTENDFRYNAFYAHDAPIVLISDYDKSK